jgi:pre-mRNA-splicing factor ISY1
MLYRFREAMLIEAGLKRNPNDTTPLIPDTCDRIPIAEQARKELLKEISRKITKIQDSSLEESQVRSLNDELNEMTKRKFAWDRRIHELGGIERRSVQIADRMGIEAPNVHEHFYFGRAKELPEYRQAQTTNDEDKNVLTLEKIHLQSRIDEGYYGDGEDGLVEAERAAEDNLATGQSPLTDWITSQPTILPEGLSRSEDPKPYSFEHVPTQEQVQKHLIDRRKQALLKRLDGAE